MILGLGARTGHANEAQRVVDALHGRLEAIARSLTGKPSVRTLFVFGLEPIVVAGPASFADEMIRRAGGDNVVREGGSYPTIGIERALALAPDVIVEAAMGESGGVSRITSEAAGWREVRAVKSGRVVSLRDNVVLRPGPRIDEGLILLAHAIHPELEAGAQ